MTALYEVAEKYNFVNAVLCDLSIGHKEAAEKIFYLSGFKTTESSVRRWRRGRVDPDLPSEAAEAARDALKPITGTPVGGQAPRPAQTLSELHSDEMRVLYIDIEMTPNLVHTWKLWQADIWHENIIVPTEMICFSAKWAGDQTQFYSTFHDGKQKMLSHVWALLDEADIVVHYYGKSFDIPRINTELLLGGFPPPSPFKQLDLCLQVKRKFGFPSNKLDYVSKVLGTSGKKKGIGYENWVKCMAGDPEAWRIMEEYSRQDTEVLPEIHAKIGPWISSPSVALRNKLTACPSCGNVTLEKRGFAYTSVSTYQRYHCTQCGKWCRDTKRISGVGVTAISD